MREVNLAKVDASLHLNGVTFVVKAMSVKETMKNARYKSLEA